MLVNDSFSTSPGLVLPTYLCLNLVLVLATYFLLQTSHCSEVCSKKYVGSTKTKFRQRFNVYKSYFRSYARKHNEGSLDRGKLIPQANFFSHFFEGNHNGKFEVRVKMIDGADNVFSLRRKELFWQYRLGTFLP